MSGKVNKQNSYNRFSCDITLLIKEEFLQTKNFCVFYILAFEEIDKIMQKIENIKEVKRSKVFGQETDKERKRSKINIGSSDSGWSYWF